MKGDFSRRTFDPQKHYACVQMQQGRVQVDADWNEEIDVLGHRIETEALDVIGDAGGPIHDAGFALSLNGANDLWISKGRYYVDGLLVENDLVNVSYLQQPDLPEAPSFANLGSYLAYLDVWQRHLTALDDPSLRESALGGPDTATRLKTVWQLKLKTTSKTTCKEALDEVPRGSTGSMEAREMPGQTSSDPCLVPAGSGYKGLENQLYRVEIHRGGGAAALGAVANAVAISSAAANEITLQAGSFAVGSWIEVFSVDTQARSAVLLVVGASQSKLTLSGDIPKFADGTKLYARAVTTIYKWSRDNGVVVTAISEIKDKDVFVTDVGRDAVLGFVEGQWVEILDDRAELQDRPTELHQIAFVDRAARKITLKTTPAKLAAAAPGVTTNLHPKLRRWDGIGAVQSSGNATTGWLDLENGIQVRFEQAGTFSRHDHWLIPARVATADVQQGRIEWPAGRALLPAGIGHHYAAIGIVQKTAAGITITDCRELFPPLTELKSFFYLGGDGQEVKPDLTAPSTLVALPQEIRVGVANGQHKVVGATVRFTILTNNDTLAPGAGMTQLAAAANTLTIATNTDGVASCVWRLSPSAGYAHQVRAELLDELGNRVHLPIVFSANLSIASEVAFLPKNCPPLKDAKDVQAAIEALAHVPEMRYAGGDGQEALPGQTLPSPLRVHVTNACGPMAKQPVLFRTPTPGGMLRKKGAQSFVLSQLEVETDNQGYAECYWQLAQKPNPPDAQVVVATLNISTSSSNSATNKVVDEIHFTARHSVARQVGYTPPDDCETLKDKKTVQDAIDALCAAKDGTCEIVLRPTMPFEKIINIIRDVLAAAEKESKDERFRGGAKFCFAPGEYWFPQTLSLEGRGHVMITGAGESTRISCVQSQEKGLESVFDFVGFSSVVVRDLEVLLTPSDSFNPEKPAPDLDGIGGVLHFRRCTKVVVENVCLDSAPGILLGSSCITVSGRSADTITEAESVRIEKCHMRIGADQIGIFVDRMKRVDIANNHLSALPTTKGLLERFTTDGKFLSEIVKTAMRLISFGTEEVAHLPNMAAGETSGVGAILRDVAPQGDKLMTRKTLGVGRYQITWESPTAIADEIEGLVRHEADKLAEAPSVSTLRSYLENLVEHAILVAAKESPVRSELGAWAVNAHQEYWDAAARGIVLTRVNGMEARIRNNEIDSALQGIFIGPTGDKEPNDPASRVMIMGNSIQVPLVASPKLSPQVGIAVGSSISTIIEHNVVLNMPTKRGVQPAPVGIFVKGTLGPLLMVRENHIEGARKGVYVHASDVKEVPSGHLWRVGDNIAVGATTAAQTIPAAMVISTHPNMN